MAPISALALFVCLSLMVFSSPGGTVNFSGTWTIDPYSTRLVKRYNPPPGLNPKQIDPGIGWPPGTGPDGRSIDQAPKSPEVLKQGLTLIIVQTEKELQITRKVSLGGQERTVTQKFPLDGSQSSNPVLGGRGLFTSQCLWDGDRLVIMGKQAVRTSELIIREEYSLSKQGKRLSLKTSGYYRANEVNDPRTFAADDPRWDVIYKQVFDKK